eukprot:Nk52_evm36s279 gene=Nk52_evmTU36s279
MADAEGSPTPPADPVEEAGGGEGGGEEENEEVVNSQPEETPVAEQKEEAVETAGENKEEEGDGVAVSSSTPGGVMVRENSIKKEEEEGNGAIEEGTGTAAAPDHIIKRDAVPAEVKKPESEKKREEEHIRRIIAEDPEWNIPTVIRLTDICIEHITTNFEQNPILNELPPRFKRIVLDNLSTEIPTNITGPLIDYEDYWKKCCQIRWKICDISQHDNSWKQLYFEQNLEELIENFIPEHSELREIEQVLSMSKPFIRKLKIKQLLPKIKEEKGSNESDDESDDEECNHLNIGSIFQGLPKLEDLDITYSVRSCGMNFNWALFGLTRQDTNKLGKFLKANTKLTVLRLSGCTLTDEKIRTLAFNLLENKTLRVLDLGHNKIGDKGARAVGKLLHNRTELEEVILADNQIYGYGAMSISKALETNTFLKIFNLKLNRIDDNDGAKFVKMLEKNKTLHTLNLCGNSLGPKTAAALGEILKSKNTTLRSLDLTCNSLEFQGGRELSDAMEVNESVTELDLRLTDIGQECEYTIQEYVAGNTGVETK